MLKYARLQAAKRLKTSHSAAGAAAGQRSMLSFLSAPEQWEEAAQSLVKIICKHSVPCAIEDEDLKKSYKVLGVDLPSRCQYTTNAAAAAVAVAAG